MTENQLALLEQILKTLCKDCKEHLTSVLGMMESLVKRQKPDEVCEECWSRLNLLFAKLKRAK